jgi:hypothetical protein
MTIRSWIASLASIPAEPSGYMLSYSSVSSCAFETILVSYG